MPIFAIRKYPPIFIVFQEFYVNFYYIKWSKSLNYSNFAVDYIVINVPYNY